MLSNNLQWQSAWKKLQADFQKARKWCELFREISRLERSGLPQDLEEFIISTFIAKVREDDYKGAMGVYSTFRDRVIEWRDRRRFSKM